MTLSRNAQLIATGWFPFGGRGSLSFLRRHILTQQAIAGLGELEATGMIEKTPENDLPPGSKGWRATEKIGNPLADFPVSRDVENFNLTTE